MTSVSSARSLLFRSHTPTFELIMISAFRDAPSPNQSHLLSDPS
jgi:hypothetical protein